MLNIHKYPKRAIIMDQKGAIIFRQVKELMIDTYLWKYGNPIEKSELRDEGI